MEAVDNSGCTSHASDAASYPPSQLSLSCTFPTYEGENPDLTESCHIVTGPEVMEPDSFERAANIIVSPSHFEVETGSESSWLDNTDW